jgi:type 1 glutamine amidotransferase
MNALRRSLLAVSLVGLVLALVSIAPAAEKAAAEKAAPAAAAAPINVLIIDGQNFHKWAETSPIIKEMLEKTGKFKVDILTSPPKGAAKEAWDKFKPDFTKYAVVLSNYSGDAWPEAVQKDFEKFVADGGGFVAYHFAVAGFEKWDAFNKMIGIGWRAGGANFGEGVYINAEGKTMKRAKGEGTGSGHPAAHLFDCTVRDAGSPITKGLPEKWTHAKDELYASLRGPVGDIHILVTAFAPKGPRDGQTGENEPIAWTNTFSKGRIFVSVLGHEKDETRYPDTAILLMRGVEWAATGAVTLPVPADFPKLEAAPATPAAPKADAKK